MAHDALEPRHPIEQDGKLPHVIDDVIWAPPLVLEVGRMELAALHQYPDGSHALRSEDISLDVVSDHDHIGGFSSSSSSAA